MKTTRDPHERPLPSRRAHPRRPTKGQRYVVTPVGGVPDDLVAIVSRAHAEALAMTHLDSGSPSHPPENDHAEEHGTEEGKS